MHRVTYFKLLLIPLLLLILAHGGWGQGDADLQEQAKLYINVLKQVQQRYVEKTDYGVLTRYAIDGMLRELDPQSIFIVKEQTSEIGQLVRNEQSVPYHTGIHLESLNGILTVQSITAASSAELAGIMSGDQILTVNGRPSYALPEEEMKAVGTGNPGQAVAMTVRRLGAPSVFDVVLRYAPLPEESILAAFLLDDGKTGYVRMVKFGKNVSDNFTELVQWLLENGMQQLIIDIRGNTGGYFQPIIEILDPFFTASQQLLSTRGQSELSTREYKSELDMKYDFPVILLTDRNTSSGGEIFAGVMQDGDRALIAGETTRGFGAIANAFMISRDATLKLTTAYYYFPSGRSINRNLGREELAYSSVVNRDLWGESGFNAAHAFKTKAGRTVYGENGVNPDYRIDRHEFDGFVSKLLRHQVFMRFAEIFINTGMNTFDDFESYNKAFAFDEHMRTMLRKEIESVNIEFHQETFDRNIQDIQGLIKAEIAKQLWGYQAFYRVRVNVTPEVDQVLSLFPKAETLLNVYLGKESYLGNNR